ncbi:MAG: YceI family protein [Chloroflexi bacterium]|nr:MAG: YceI family protein [Chloroflexota bacterium]
MSNTQLPRCRRLPNHHLRQYGPRRVRWDQWRQMGDLTIKDVTRQVELLTQFTCSAIDDFGNDKVASLTHAKVSRREIGLTHELIKEAGSLLVGHDLEISLAVEAIRTG